MKKNIAVLFVGRSNLFPKVSRRIKSAFDDTNHNIFYFGHTWLDDFMPIDRNDSVDDLRGKLFSKDVEIIKNSLNFHDLKTSSYNEMLDLIEKVDYGVPRLKTMFLSYVSQFYSLQHAINAAIKFAEINNIQYDAVIKWRYDLVVDNVKLDFNDLHENMLYVDNFSSNIAINDQYFYGTYNTMKTLCNNPGVFLNIFLNAVYSVYKQNHDHSTIEKLVNEDKVMFSERMFKEMCCHLINDIKFVNERRRLIYCCLIKDGADPTWSIPQLENFLSNNWEGFGWDNRVLIHPMTTGPVTGKIKLVDN